MECDSIVKVYNTKDSLRIVKEQEHKDHIQFQKELIEQQYETEYKLRKRSRFFGGGLLVSVPLIVLAILL